MIQSSEDTHPITTSRFVIAVHSEKNVQSCAPCQGRMLKISNSVLKYLCKPLLPGELSFHKFVIQIPKKREKLC